MTQGVVFRRDSAEPSNSTSTTVRSVVATTRTTLSAGLEKRQTDAVREQPSNSADQLVKAVATSLPATRQPQVVVRDSDDEFLPITERVNVNATVQLVSKTEGDTWSMTPKIAQRSGELSTTASPGSPTTTPDDVARNNSSTTTTRPGFFSSLFQ